MYSYIIVDDEPLIRRGIKKKLESLENEITCRGEAANGKAALDLIEQKNPDVIITDMRMPVMDGTTLLPLLSERYPGKYLIVISGYKDFEYTRYAIRANAVDYLLKPVREEELVASMRNALRMLEAKTLVIQEITHSREEQERSCYEHDIQMLTNLVLGYHTAEVQLTSEKLKFTEKLHQLILITLHSPQPLSAGQLAQFLEENGFGDLALYLQHVQAQNLGFLILFLPSKSALPAMDLCRQVVSSLQRLHSSRVQEVSYGISGLHTSLLELHEAFLESVNALNQRHPMERSQCYISGQEALALPVTWDEEEELLFAIEAGMSGRIRDLLQNLFSHLAGSPEYTLFDVKQYCYYLTNRVKLMAALYFDQIKGGDVNANTQNTLNTLFTLDELHTYYLQFFMNISNAIFPASVYTSENVVENIKNYVERNYQKDLSVEFISSLFNLNRNYCSTVFKEKTGDTLINYINQVRIDRAKELLKHTDKKMYQISRSVGYENVKYFFRVFKKYAKVSPEQYRKQFD